MTGALPSVGRLLFGVAVWNLLQNSVPRQWYGFRNSAGSVAVVVAGRASGVSSSEIGLGPGSLRRGMRTGGPPAALIVAATQAAAATETGLRMFRDERVQL